MRYEPGGIIGGIFSSYSDIDEVWGTELYAAENVASLINNSWYTLDGTDLTPTVTEYVGGGEDDGSDSEESDTSSTGDKNYKYTVSGFSDNLAGGER